MVPFLVGFSCGVHRCFFHLSSAACKRTTCVSVSLCAHAKRRKESAKGPTTAMRCCASVRDARQLSESCCQKQEDSPFPTFFLDPVAKVLVPQNRRWGHPLWVELIDGALRLFTGWRASRCHPCLDRRFYGGALLPGNAQMIRDV